MTRLVDQPETERGRAIFQELLWVHSAIRRDLEVVEGLAADVENGLPGEAVEKTLKQLKTSGPLWRLKVNCLRYCRFVHSHHRAEDALLFPALRAVDPSMDPIVDRLEGDHARVSDLLDAIDDAAQALSGTDADKARRRVVDRLQELHSELLAHLDYEELDAGPAMRRLEGLST
jgi:Hemerythrin HHE cation binding domain